MLKNKILLAFLLISTVFTACSKKEDYDAEKHLAIDDAKIVKYLADNNITTVQKDNASGLYYEIINAGTGTVSPTVSSIVTVAYDGKILGSTSSFQTVLIANPVEFPLGNVIDGWKIGIPLIKAGGKIRLIIPSPLAYKDYEQNGIAANSILDFTIDLVTVK